MKIVFIAGPYTGDGTFESIERNIREAEKYQIALANKEIGFFAPIITLNILVARKALLRLKSFIMIWISNFSRVRQMLF